MNYLSRLNNLTKSEIIQNSTEILDEIINCNDIEDYKSNNNFFELMKLVSADSKNYNILKTVFQKCNYSKDEIRENGLEDIYRRITREKRVSWNENLVEIMKIEPVKNKRIKKVFYEYDVEKITNCEKEEIREILRSLEL